MLRPSGIECSSVLALTIELAHLPYHSSVLALNELAHLPRTSLSTTLATKALRNSKKCFNHFDICQRDDQQYIESGRIN